MDACVIGLRRPTGELSLPPVASNSPTEIKKLRINLTRAAGMWYYIYVVYGRSFNRTSLELKLCNDYALGARHRPFNRTSLELKPLMSNALSLSPRLTFNRTSLELKLLFLS